MNRLRTIATRTAVIAAVCLGVAGAPAAASAGGSPVAGPIGTIAVDVCDTVAAVAGPILDLVDLGVIDLETAVDLIADLTGLPVTVVTDCLEE
jgi:hypothetical protein